MMAGFFKGMGMGIVAGAAITVALVPVDKRRMMKSPVGKTMKTICNVYEGIQDAF